MKTPREDTGASGMFAPAISMYVRKVLSHRHGGAFVLCLFLLSISFLTRLALLLRSRAVVDNNPLELIGVFTCGFLYDVITASYFVIPMVLYLTVVPEKIFGLRMHRRVSVAFLFLALFGLLFGATAEWLFWSEFGVRFNFIAVDYLVYTTQVLGNISESYSVPMILSGLLLVSGLLFLGLYRTGLVRVWLNSKTPARSRTGWGIGLLLIPLIFTFAVNNRMVPRFGNNYNQELAKNGIYSLFAAFRDNEIDYGKFYKTEDNREAFRRTKELLNTDNSTFLSEDPFGLIRIVTNEGEEKHYNIIQITVESLSASFMTAFGNKENMTPNLDAIADQGILFTHFYATGTRTDRGMEALSLSLPPTPGRSIIKRPHNEHLFSLGSVLQDHDYDTAFLYGGYGYFDNMNYFFENNGYKIIDRAAVAKGAVTFANIWGACDEDLFNWDLDEADCSYSKGKPFFHLVMTTSNHRPYTYPTGRIGIPSHTGRKGAVEYSDYAIGEFIRKAKEKPWFSNTVIVIVADHCANSAGKTDLPIKNYRIPLIIYNPELFPPQRVDTLCSQIDVPPTLLGLLHWTYKSEFYGKDVFRMGPGDGRAFIGNYQMLGYMRDGDLTILKPIGEVETYRYDLLNDNLVPGHTDSNLIGQAIAYYQSASYAFHHRANPVSN